MIVAECILNLRGGMSFLMKGGIKVDQRWKTQPLKLGVLDPAVMHRIVYFFSFFPADQNVSRL